MRYRIHMKFCLPPSERQVKNARRSKLASFISTLLHRKQEKLTALYKITIILSPN